jgi:hypothetical protein
MTTYHGSTQVKSGYYFSATTLGVEVIGQDGGALPGASATRYVRVPFPLLFLIIPVVGLAFLMFLPFVGFALLGAAMGQTVAGRFQERAGAFAATVAPPHATGAAYLGGRESEEENLDVSPELERLEREVAARRRAA